MKYDVIIVGASSGGGTIAARLSEIPTLSVLLLEAGPDQRLEQTPDHATGDTEPRNPHNRVPMHTSRITPLGSRNYPAMIGIAGNPSISGQEFPYGLPEDYERWTTSSIDDWSFSKVLPYFQKLDSDSHLQSYIYNRGAPKRVTGHDEDWLTWQKAFHDAALDSGYEMIFEHFYPGTTGFGLTPANSAAGKWMNMAPAYLDMCRHRLNCTIRADVPVQRILFDGPRARGVEVKSGGEVYTVEGEQVILCAGAVGSPKILMQSGIGPAAYLEEIGLPMVRDMPGVGQNLRDRTVCPVKVRTRPGLTLNADMPAFHSLLRNIATAAGFKNDMHVTPNVSLQYLGKNLAH